MRDSTDSRAVTTLIEAKFAKFSDPKPYLYLLLFDSM